MTCMMSMTESFCYMIPQKPLKERVDAFLKFGKFFDGDGIALPHHLRVFKSKDLKFLLNLQIYLFQASYRITSNHRPQFYTLLDLTTQVQACLCYDLDLLQRLFFLWYQLISVNCPCHQAHEVLALFPECGHDAGVMRKSYQVPTLHSDGQVTRETMIVSFNLELYSSIFQNPRTLEPVLIQKNLCNMKK